MLGTVGSSGRCVEALSPRTCASVGFTAGLEQEPQSFRKGRNLKKLAPFACHAEPAAGAPTTEVCRVLRHARDEDDSGDSFQGPSSRRTALERRRV